MELTILPELRDYLGDANKLADDELERQLVETNGPVDTIWVWDRDDGKKVLVEGHRRYGICKRLGLPYEDRVRLRKWADLDAVKEFMESWGLARRNYGSVEMSMHFGRLVDLRKARGVKNAEAEVAAEHGLSERSVFRATAFAAAVKSLPEDMREPFLTGAIDISQADMVKFAGLGETFQRIMMRDWATGQYKKFSDLLKHSADSEPAPKPDSVSGSETGQGVSAKKQRAQKPETPAHISAAKSLQSAMSQIVTRVDAIQELVPDKALHKEAKNLLHDLNVVCNEWSDKAKAAK